MSMSMGALLPGGGLSIGAARNAFKHLGEAFRVFRVENEKSHPDL
jgi:hypothetical protein